MLETVAIVLLILWALGMVSSYTMGGFIHVLLVIAVVVVLMRVIRGRGALQRGGGMNTLRLIALTLIIAGGLGAVYGGFSYTKETHTADIGPLHLQVREQERVNIPLWVGLGAMAAGLLVLVMARKG